MHSSYSVVVLSLLVPVLGCAWGLKGTVSDPGGFVVPGAVLAVTCGGRSWSAKTGSQGRFVFPRWGPGENCGISANYRGFAPFHRDLDRETESVSIRLNLAPLNQSITVASSSDAFTVPAFGTVSLSDVELQRVSNDTEDLLRYAKLMAGASASPDAIYVDGLPAAELPPAETIARITVNGDPFSAEYPDGDLTHINITTKGGDRKLRYGFGGFSFSAGGRSTLDPNFRSQSGSGNGYVSGPVPYFLLTFSLHGNFLTHVLEEVFLTPAFEHPVGDNDIAQVPPARQYGRLLAVVGESRHLAQPEFASQKPHGLVGEKVFHRTAIQLGRPQDESLFGNPPHTALPVGHDVKTHRQQLLEEFGTPSSTVEDDHDAPAGTDPVADLFEYRYPHPGHRGVGFSGHDKERLSLLIVDPVVGRPRDGQAGPGEIGFGDRVFAMIGPDTAIDIEEAHHAASLGDAAPGQFAAEFLAGLPGRQARQFAA